MRQLFRPCRYLALASLCVAVYGCMLFDRTGEPERTTVHPEELPALTELSFAHSSLRFHPQSPGLAAQLESLSGISRDVWSLPVQQVMHRQETGLGSGAVRLSTPGSGEPAAAGSSRAPAPAADGFFYTEHLNRITEQTARAVLQGRTVFVLSTARDSQHAGSSGAQHDHDRHDDPVRRHAVFALAAQSGALARFETDGVDPVRIADGLPRGLPSQALQFDLVSGPDRVLIVYLDHGITLPAPATLGGVMVLWGPEFKGSKDRYQDLVYGHLSADLQLPRISSARLPGTDIQQSAITSIASDR